MRYLNEQQVTELLPEPLVAVELAREALVARASGRAETPPKPAVQLPGGGFANAMPSAIVDRDLAGCKWVTLSPGNPALGLPTAQGLVVVGDAATGTPRCIMQAGALTAARTAAVSGACLASFGDRGRPVAIVGAGAQARSHLLVLAALGFVRVRCWARRPEAADELRRWAAEEAGIDLVTSGDRAEVVRGAGAVITALTIGLRGLELGPDEVAEDALLLPLDYASSVGADLARTATLCSDDLAQFNAIAASKLAPDYPLATAWTGDLLSVPRPPGRLLCQNLGNGSTDLVFAAHLAEQAAGRGLGILLD